MKPIAIQQISEPVQTRAKLAHAANERAPRGNDVAAERAAEPSMVARSRAASAGVEAPVDQDRVSEIRQALKEGTYPLVPAKVADAIIAARYLLAQ